MATPPALRSRRHFVIPDVQVKPGVCTDHLEWIGKYINEKRPDVIVCLGDFADLPSLSSYDKGKRSFEGRRYKADINAAKEAMLRLTDPFMTKGYNPRMVLTLGNHENRINRATDNDPMLDGTIGIEDLEYESFGWEVIPFLRPIRIDGFTYVHYVVTGAKGLAAGTAKRCMSEIMGSVVVGHNQNFDVAVHPKTQQVAIMSATCLAPTTRVLTSDLRYVQLGSCQAGDKLVSFDEMGGGDGKRSRRFRTGTVEAITTDKAELYRVELSDGTVFDATADHRWLAQVGSIKYVWRRTDELQPIAGKRGGTRIPKLLPTWKTLSSFESLRPMRLLSKFTPESLGHLNTTEHASVASVRRIGIGEIVRVAIDRGTMVAEGYGHHNCYLHNEGYLGEQGQNHRRQIVVLNEVNNGRADPMLVSLSYLGRKYGGRR